MTCDEHPIRAIAFDFNDTLSKANFVTAFQEYEDRLGMTAREFISCYERAGLLDSLMRGRYSSEREFWQEVSKLTGVNFELTQEMVRAVTESRHIDEYMLYLVKRLQCHWKVALATDNLLETFNLWVSQFALDSMFDVILNSAECGYLKKEPEFYQILAERLDVPVSTVLMIDDSMPKLQVAASCGMQIYLFQEAAALERHLVDLGLLIDSPPSTV